jgi:cobalamin biosynthesis protein CobW
MSKLLDRSPQPEHIVIETSGLALPQPLVRAFGWPEIKSRVTVDGVVTVVDGAALADGRFAADEQALARQREADANLDHDSPIAELFDDQLACADLVLVNKCDLLDEAGRDSVLRQLFGKVRSGTRLLRTERGRIAARVLLGLEAEAETDLDARPSRHELEGDIGHDHDDFESFVVPLEIPTTRDKILSRIAGVLERHDILRMKGFLAVTDAPARLLVQTVGPRLDNWFDRPWRDDEQRSGRLVVIGLKGLDRTAITAALQTPS